MKAQKWIVEKEFLGEPSSENLSLVDFEIPDELADGGKLVSLDESRVWVNVSCLTIGFLLISRGASAGRLLVS